MLAIDVKLAEDIESQYTWDDAVFAAKWLNQADGIRLNFMYLGCGGFLVSWAGGWMASPVNWRGVIAFAKSKGWEG